MDYVVTELLEHLQGRTSNPNEFFEAVHADYEQHRDDFDSFRSTFLNRGFGTAGEEFVKYLDDHGGLELAAKIADERPDELAAVYLRLGEADSVGGAQDPGVDSAEAEANWATLLAEYSAHWDGDEQNWPAFEQYVMYYATERGLAGPAQRFFERAVSEDKQALFAEYGVTLHLESDGTDADEDADALWQAVIEQFGSAWAAWDGTGAQWAEYRDWFYDATNSQDPNMYALAYERLEPLNDLTPDERITRLRELGFDVSGAGAEAENELDDEAGWTAYIAEYSAYWDGNEDSWAAFTETVQEYAEETFGLPAREFFARAAQGEDKHALFAQYGVTVGAFEESLAGLFDEEAAAASRQRLQEAVAASDAIPDGDAELIAEAFDEVLAMAPEFGGSPLTPGQIDQLMDMLTQESAAEPQPAG